MSETTRFFTAIGKVQKIMFRQTVIRGALSRNLKAGATNVKTDKTKVLITLSGENESIQEMIEKMRKGEKLNNWGAYVTEVIEHDKGFTLSEHKVTTENVDSFNWKSGVEFYL